MWQKEFLDIVKGKSIERKLLGCPNGPHPITEALKSQEPFQPMVRE